MQATQPALQIDAADGAAYEAVATVLAQAKAQGLARIDMLGVR
jgi:biopolymer transport protein ExbD